MDETEVIDVMSYDEAFYLDVQKEKGAEAEEQLELMGIGVTEMTENSNPTESEKQYINQKSKTTTVTGYGNEWALTSDLLKNEKVVEYLHDIFRSRKTGIYAQQNLYIVELWNKTEDSKYKARKVKTSAIISEKTYTPGETITLSGSLKGVTDIVDGTFDITAKKFTAAETVSSSGNKPIMPVPEQNPKTDKESKNKESK